ncbi:MAG: DUF4340 domain-containing protein [Lachnospiraceae bacterium]|nr:DUF4340 domain-containing protein [Lachnospiraceae bacterium]
MKKQIRTLAVLGLIFLLSVGAWAGIRIRFADAGAAVSPAVRAFDAAAGDIDRVEVGGASFVRSGSGWGLPADSSLAVDNTKLNTICDVIAGLTLGRPVDVSGTEAARFFSEPLRVSAAAGEKTVSLIVGQENPVTGETYFRTQEDGPVYLSATHLRTAFDQDLLDLIAVPGLPAIDAAALKHFEILREGQEDISVTCAPDGRPESDHSGEFKYFLTLKDRGEVPANQDKMSEVLGVLAGMKPHGCVSVTASQEELAKYGLDSPEMTVRFADTAGTHEICIGNEDESGLLRYVWETGSRYIYTTEFTSVVNLQYVTAEGLCALNTGYVGVSSLNGLDVRVKDQAWHIDVIESTDIEVISGGSPYRFAIDGTAVDTYDFTMLYINFADPKGEKLFPLDAAFSADMLSPDKVEMQIDLDLKNKTYFDTVSLQFVPYDQNYYVLAVNGQPRLLANKLEVGLMEEKLTGGFAALLRGETLPVN